MRTDRTRRAIRTVIRPNEVFDKLALQHALGLNIHTIAREVKLRRLPVYFRAKKYFFLGADVLAWLKAGQKKSDLE